MVGSGEAENADYLMRFNGLGNQQHGFRIKSIQESIKKEILSSQCNIIVGDALEGLIQPMTYADI